MTKRNILRGDKRFWAPIAIGSGLTITFFGISYVTTHMWIGCVDIVFGVLLLIVGFCIAPIRS